MTSKPKRWWRPRFGLRLLFALMLFVAAYFGSWPWVENAAIDKVRATAQGKFVADVYANEPQRVIRGSPLFVDVKSEFPFLLSAEVANYDALSMRRRYYLWLFGWTVRLPITTEWE